ncbi:uncharacterized protein [Paramisgurnus dabryanus]|uniref:uncharacterized protein n=1 Tax=Paramisgurnus dabryanus TaxID=90735 RepID=UPI003CCF69C8
MFSKLSTVVILFSGFCAALCELSISAYRGERANIECAYTADNIFSLKYFFKMKAGHNLNDIYTLNRRRFLQKGRVSITDDHQRKILQVSIDSLSESDSGLYACAVGKGHNVETFVVVRLSVMMAPQKKVNSVRSSVPTERSFIKHTETSKCDMVTELFTPTLSAITKTTSNETDHSDWRWMALYVGPSVVIVAVSGVLILVCCFRCRKRSLQNTRHRKSACKPTGNSKTERTENQYNESHVRSKRHASIYQELNKKQSDPIYECLNYKNNLKN